MRRMDRTWIAAGVGLLLSLVAMQPARAKQAALNGSWNPPAVQRVS